MTEIFVSGTEIFSDAKMTETPYDGTNDGGLTCMLIPPCDWGISAR